MDNAALDQMVQTYEGCTIAAFADFDVGIPLRTASGTRVGQEALNMLCARAKTVFKPVPASALIAVEASEGVIYIFVRAQDDPASGLIAQIDHTVALDVFLEQAKTCMGHTT